MPLLSALLLAANLAAAVPADLEALLSRGEAALRSGDVIEAMRAFQAARELDQGSWRVADALGRAWRAAGDLEAAQRELRRAVSLAPQENRAAENLADLIDALSDEEERREGWAWLGAHAAGSADLQLRVARAARREGDLVVAAAALERALALEPNRKDARMEQIRVHRDALDYDGAERLAQAFLQAHPRHAETYVQLGRIYQMQDRLEDAVAHYREALDLDPTHATALYRAGEIRLIQGRLDEAAELLEMAVVVAPDRYQVHYTLGQLYLRQGRPADAARRLEIFRKMQEARRASTRLAGGAALESD